MRLYIVRHGETKNNVEGLFTGWADDVMLTEKGISDAKELSFLCKNKKFDKIYSSDLKRAIETAKAVISDCSPEKTMLLREINVGSLSGKPFNVCDEKSRSERSYISYGGEDTTMLTKRIAEFLKSLEDKNFNNVIAFSHGGYLIAMLSYILKQPISTTYLKCPNCTVAVFEFDKVWKLRSWIDPEIIKP